MPWLLKSVMQCLPALNYNEIVSGTLVSRPNTAPIPTAGSRVFTCYTLGGTDPPGTNRQVMSNAVSFSFGEPGTNQDVSGGLVQLMNPISGSPFQVNWSIPLTSGYRTKL